MDDEPDWENILFKASVAITDNPRFNEWFESLSPQTQKIVDEILDHNVTPEMIDAAQDSSNDDWDRYTFLRALGGGTCDPTLANDLTDVVLGLVPWDIGREKRLGNHQ